MRNIVGQTPRGNDFFPRNNIIRKIYRRLEAGSHIFLSAPRRAGKTSIMRFLEDNPKKGHAFIYINTEDVDNSEEFFKTVCEKLLTSNAVEQMTKAAESSKTVFKQFTENISKIKVWHFELQLNKTNAPQYKDELEKLMRKLDTGEFKIVIMLDEYPVTIENIRNKFGAVEAINFMHANRNIRQEAKRGIQFIYTGSIGLPTIAKRLEATATLNDLNVLEIPPLKMTEATVFSKQILDNYKIEYAPDVVSYMLNRVEWLMPFFIQLVVQKMIDEFDETGKKLTRESVDMALMKSGTHRSNLYFENYLTRLDKTLPQEEAKIAKHILKQISSNGELPIGSFDNLAMSGNILEMLELDGYITSTDGTYRFNSPILGAWWKKHAA